jgi:ATP-dependent RNA helicase RhlE
LKYLLRAMTFNDLNLNKPLLNALGDLGFTQATTIQQKAFPVIMSGRDVVGIAQTGTGKTFAYLLPCLRLWTFKKDRSPEILILVPTRELVVQVVEQVQKLCAYMNVVVAGVYGGANMKTQAEMLYGGVDVLVATPGRLLDLALNGSVKLKTVKRFVIDEVDEMLHMGFRTQLTGILDLLPPRRQNLMFSATITADVQALIDTFFNAPARIEAAPAGTPLDNIQQTAYYVPNFNTKINLLQHLLSDASLTKVLVFTASIRLADQVFGHIEKMFQGQAGIIHSEKTQPHRFEVVRKFDSGTIRLLIATDLVARGIDVAHVSHVINFDVPDFEENYIHRIGRTGRADRKGIAITFITPKDQEYITAIQSLMNYEIPVSALPSEVEISDVLTEDEKPRIAVKEIQLKVPKKENVGPSFHEKKGKNKKVNMHKTRAMQMREKYGKPKTKGGGKKGRKK